jgi:hypothetical protein
MKRPRGMFEGRRLDAWFPRVLVAQDARSRFLWFVIRDSMIVIEQAL